VFEYSGAVNILNKIKRHYCPVVGTTLLVSSWSTSKWVVGCIENNQLLDPNNVINIPALEKTTLGRSE
jgi:hypothetical protein